MSWKDNEQNELKFTSFQMFVMKGLCPVTVFGTYTDFYCTVLQRRIQV